MRHKFLKDIMKACEDNFESGLRIYRKGGGGAGCGGGAAGSGKTEYPDHVTKAQKYWLYNGTGSETQITYSIAGDILTARDNNPYGGLLAYDPTGDLDQANQAVSDVIDATRNIDVISQWQEYLDIVATKATKTFVEPDELTTRVESYEDRADYGYNRAVNRFNAMMADANAVSSSAFVIGRAIIEAEHLVGGEDFNAQISLNAYKDRSVFIMQCVNDLVRLAMSRVEMERAGANLMAELMRIKVVANKEYYDSERDLAINDSLWDLQLYQYGSNMLAAACGGTVTPGVGDHSAGHGTSVSMLGGALSGAAMGAMIGTAVLPGIGTALGATISAGTGGLIGAGMGGLGGLFM